MVRYKDWLQNEFVLQNPRIAKRKLKPFDDCSERTKKRRMNDLRVSNTEKEIEGAFIENLRSINKIDAEIIDKLSKASQTLKEQVLKVIQGDAPPSVSYSPEEALAVMVDLKLTQHQYNLLHNQAKTRNADIYPPYMKIFEVKQECYPPFKFFEVTDYGANIKLQPLLNLTSERLLKICDSNLLENITKPRIHVIYKWGLDGASGQSSYKQIFQNDPGDVTDASIVMISLVPLQVKSSNGIIWTNPTPSSTKFCRPIRFEFIKETTDTINQQYSLIQEQIDQLHCTTININGKILKKSHELFCTMLDGKSINARTSTSSSTCNICGSKPSQMNNIGSLKRRICNEENYMYGISSLHCWIRFFECLLHIAYKLPIKKWTTRGDSKAKAKVKKNKKRIQSIYQKEKGKTII